MTDSLDYDIAQLQTDLNRLQSDLARLENDLNSEVAGAVIGESNSLVAEEIAEAEILTGEEIIPASIIPEPVVYDNQGWSPTPIPTTSMMDEEIAQAELAQAQKALTTAAEALTDEEVANILTHSNMENMNMINHPNRSQKIRNAIASLIAAASTLIAAEAGAMWEEGEKQKSNSRKPIVIAKDDPEVIEAVLFDLITKIEIINEDEILKNINNLKSDLKNDSAFEIHDRAERLKTDLISCKSFIKCRESTIKNSVIFLRAITSIKNFSIEQSIVIKNLIDRITRKAFD